MKPTHWDGIVVIALLGLMMGGLPSRAEDAESLKKKIAELEAQLAEAKKGGAEDRELETLREANKLAARQRAAEDRKHYKVEALREIESLYQVANENWRTDKARESLAALLAKYDRANRTGCATLYMGQMSDGQERLDYLTRAVEKFSDCYYLNGCQVGGYGRYLLALTLWHGGEKEKARQRLAEIRKDYKDAIDHRGRRVTDLVDAAEKGLGMGTP